MIRLHVESDAGWKLEEEKAIKRLLISDDQTNGGTNGRGQRADSQTQTLTVTTASDALPALLLSWTHSCWRRARCTSTLTQALTISERREGSDPPAAATAAAVETREARLHTGRRTAALGGGAALPSWILTLTSQNKNTHALHLHTALTPARSRPSPVVPPRQSSPALRSQPIRGLSRKSRPSVQTHTNRGERVRVMRKRR